MRIYLYFQRNFVIYRLLIAATFADIARYRATKAPNASSSNNLRGVQLRQNYDRV